MRNLKPFFTLLLSCAFISGFSFENSQYVSIESLVKSGIVSATVNGLGGHKEECVEFTLTNHKADSTYVWIEAGRRLESYDKGEQDIFLVRNEKVGLGPGETKKVAGRGFCCQSKKAGPGEHSKFTIGAMAVASWVLLANLIDKYHFPTSPVQNAVWVLSNGHDIRSITPIRGRPTIRLRECVADILEIDLPWYSYGYMDSEDSTELFSGVKDKIVAEVPFSVPRRTMITGQIKDKSGNLLYQSASYHANRGENVYFLEADIHDWAIGEYDFYLMEDFGTLNQKRSFTVVADEIIEPEGGLDEGLIIDG